MCFFVSGGRVVTHQSPAVLVSCPTSCGIEADKVSVARAIRVHVVDYSYLAPVHTQGSLALVLLLYVIYVLSLYR